MSIRALSPTARASVLIHLPTRALLSMYDSDAISQYVDADTWRALACLQYIENNIANMHDFGNVTTKDKYVYRIYFKHKVSYMITHTRNTWKTEFDMPLVYRNNDTYAHWHFN